MQPTQADKPLEALDQIAPNGDELIVPLYAEGVTVSRRRVAKSVVCVATVTHHRDHLINEALTYERIEIERVPIGQYVDAAPPVREEGDLTIMPVVEEVVIVERKLLLREEVHIRRVRTTEQHIETVQIREQEAVVTRTLAREPDVPASLPNPPPLTLETE
jgi:stress response protein YsnF